MSTLLRSGGFLPPIFAFAGGWKPPLQVFPKTIKARDQFCPLCAQGNNREAGSKLSRLMFCKVGRLARKNELVGIGKSHFPSNLNRAKQIFSYPKSLAWPQYRRAGDRIRTDDNDVGNVVLYQLSYTRSFGRGKHSPRDSLSLWSSRLHANNLRIIGRWRCYARGLKGLDSRQISRKRASGACGLSCDTLITTKLWPRTVRRG